MKNVEYLVMVEAAENLYIARKEYQEYIDARDALRIKYPDDKQYMEVLRDATNEGEHKGEIAYLRMLDEERYCNPWE